MVDKTLGHYEILEPLGAGGMGEVYRARDTTLDREVAIKVLPSALAASSEHAQRFEREAKAVAALDHPNIVGVHSIELAEGPSGEPVRFITMQLVEGRNLSEVIPSDGLSLDELFDLGIQLADAVSAAHEHGITHRDLKPTNVMVAHDGRAKVLDFGLAKLFEADDEAVEITQAATAAAVELTEEGKVLGTVSYMSPEQAEGKKVDHRTDIFSLGIMLYEMATGERPFKGDTKVSIVSSIVKDTPSSVADLNRNLPRHLGRIVKRCLEKDPERRLQSAKDLRNDLVELRKEIDSGELAIGSGDPIGRGTGAWNRTLWRVGPVAVAVVAVVALYATIFGWGDGSEPPEQPLMRLENARQVTSMPGNERTPTLSPDGEWIAFASESAGNYDIWIKNVGVGGEPIQITHDPADDFTPDWSPDGNTIVFRSRRRGGGVFTVPAFGGPVTRLTDFGYQPRWSPDGTRIVFQQRRASFVPNEIYTVEYPAGQPTIQEVFADAGGADWYNRGKFSPDGTHLLVNTGYYEVGGAVGGVATIPIDGRWDRSFVQQANGDTLRCRCTWVPGADGLTGAGDGSIWFYPFVNLERTAVATPVQLTTGGALLPDSDPDVADDGARIVWRSASSNQDIWRLEMDPETGRPVGSPVNVSNHPASDRHPIALPDGRHFVFVSDRSGTRALHIAELDGANERLLSTLPAGLGAAVTISPDGEWIVFPAALLPFDPLELEVTGQPVRLDYSLGSWSPDGRYLTSSRLDDQTQLRALENAETGTPTEVVWELDPEFDAAYPNIGHKIFSADGRWLIFGGNRELHRPSLFAVRVGGTEPRLVFEGSRFPLPFHDPNRIYLISDRPDETETRVGFVDFDPETGDVGDFQIIPLAPTYGSGTTWEKSMTPDGRWLFYRFTEIRADLYVAEISR